MTTFTKVYRIFSRSTVYNFNKSEVVTITELIKANKNILKF